MADQPTRNGGGAPTRNYVCLERHTFEDTIGEDDGTYFVHVGQVEARNATNAMRKAYREFKGAAEGESVFVVIPESMWRPTPVKGTRRPDVTVSIG